MRKAPRSLFYMYSQAIPKTRPAAPGSRLAFIMPRSHRVLSALCHLAVLAAVVSGCSTSEAPRQAAEPSSASTKPLPPKASGEIAAASSTSVTSTAPKPPSARELILTTSQLDGAGWKPGEDVDPEAAEPQPSSQPGCSNQSWTLRTPDMLDTAGASWHFDQAAEGESITSQAFVYRDERAATTALAAYRDVVSRCTSWRAGPDPARLGFQQIQEPFEVPVGAESVARALTVTLISAPDIPPSTLFWVASRVGSSIVQVTFHGGTLLGNGGKERVADLARRAVAQAT